MGRPRAAINAPFDGVNPRATYGLPPHARFELPDMDSRGARLFAITISDMRPRVFEFADDAQGATELANLMRSEYVVRVIRGERVDVNVSSVVQMTIGGRIVEDTLPIPETIHGT